MILFCLASASRSAQTASCPRRERYNSADIFTRHRHEDASTVMNEPAMSATEHEDPFPWPSLSACSSLANGSRSIHWLNSASERLHKNKLAVALANKLARIAWSVLRHDKPFDTHLEPPQSRPRSSSRLRNCMERIDRRTLNLVNRLVARQPAR